MGAADAWLQANLAPLLANPTFQQDGLLIITWDEGRASDINSGGGHIATLLAGPRVKQGHKSTSMYQHQSTLRLILQLLGAHGLPGAAASAPDMGEFFQ